MIRTILRYHRPTTYDDASALLAEYAGNVAILGGGTQLIPKMSRDEIHVEHVVDLRDLDLKRISITDKTIEIGALITYADILDNDELRIVSPLLSRASAGITGGRQIVQQGTLVGAACLNHPGSDMPGVFVALNARMRLHGLKGGRDVVASAFFRGAMNVDVRPGEFVTGVLVDHASDVGYCKVKHSGGSWPIATASAVRRSENPSITVTLGAVEAVPICIEIDVEGDIETQIKSAIVSPWSDELAPGSYRAAIAHVVARRAIAEIQEQV
jgi:carbon-monoxide dehydrogenase medium subunit